MDDTTIGDAWPFSSSPPLSTDHCYAIVVKERKHGRVIHVTTRVVYGTIAQVEAALQVSPVSRTINTYGVERNNLTVRQHARRLGRKVNAFSKEPDYLEHQLTLALAYYPFVVPHRSLRQRLPHSLPTKGRNGSRKKWKPGDSSHGWAGQRPCGPWMSCSAFVYHRGFMVLNDLCTRYRDTT